MKRLNMIKIVFGVFLLVSSELCAISNLGKVGECFLNAGVCYMSRTAGNYVYVGCTYGLMILEVSDSSQPVLAGSYLTTNPCRALEIQGDYVYLAGDDYYLTILDISNPHHPVVASECEYPEYLSYACTIEIQGDHLFVGGSYNHSNLCIIDISDPFDPLVVNYDDSGIYRDFAINGNSDSSFSSIKICVNGVAKI